MSKEYSDRFQIEVLESLHKLVAKSIEHDKRFDAHDKRFDWIESSFASVAGDLKTLSSQFNDVGSMAIKDNQRIDGLGKRVDDLEAGAH